jgi:glycosyltransferase involved in cell wall biosynthesis
MTEDESGHPLVSVVVCAYTEDRWDDIVAALDGCAAQTLPPLEVLLVVDHNDALLARAASLGVTVLENDRTRGLSGARNVGIAAARGEVVAFLDDDATPDPDWLARLVGAYTAPAIQATGGSARPQWPVDRPAHLPHALDWVVGCTYEGQPETRADVRNLMGCNMSFRREVFDRVGGFDENAGRVGLLPLGCEETELCIRLRQRIPGSRIVFEPDAVVTHRVTEARTTWAYLRQRSYSEGVSKAAISRLVGSGAATQTERSYLRQVIVRAVLREAALGLRGRRSGLTACAGLALAVAATGFGFLRGRLGLARDTGRAARQAPAAT